MNGRFRPTDGLQARSDRFAMIPLSVFTSRAAYQDVRADPRTVHAVVVVPFSRPCYRPLNGFEERA
jgi:hypothetical protein